MWLSSVCFGEWTKRPLLNKGFSTWTYWERNIKLCCTSLAFSPNHFLSVKLFSDLFQLYLKSLDFCLGMRYSERYGLGEPIFKQHHLRTMKTAFLQKTRMKSQFSNRQPIVRKLWILIFGTTTQRIYLNP